MGKNADPKEKYRIILSCRRLRVIKLFIFLHFSAQCGSYSFIWNLVLQVSNFAKKISQKLNRPQQKFVHQMIYGILAGNKLHLSEIARSLKENITLKKTIDRLSRNLTAFDEKESVMQDYLSLVKQHIKEDYAVIIIDNSDIAKPASRKLEALSEIRDGSTGEITQGYLTIEAAVLSEPGKMPLPVYEKVFSAAEEGFVSETYENLCCLQSLSENFSPKCVRTLDRGFDANDYYRYFLKRRERLYAPKRTGMSSITGIPATSWMWH